MAAVPIWAARRAARLSFLILQRFWVFLLVLAAVPALYVLLWLLPQWEVAPLRHLQGVSPLSIVEAENHARATWAQIAGGTFLLLGVVFAYWRIEVAREGQITDRFSRAIELLGSEKEVVRLGGIYALERIGNDSQRDYWPVISVLTTFLQTKHPRKDEPGKRADIPPTAPGLPADTLVILGVLARRQRARERKGDRLNLSGTDLRGAFFRDVHFEGAFFADADLDGATFVSEKAPDMNLGWLLYGRIDPDIPLKYDDRGIQRFVAATAGGCRLEGANLDRASLRESFLSGIHLENASLAYADLRGANLWQARLKGASLVCANLEGAMLHGADLRKASLFRASFKNAQFDGAVFEGVNFWETDLAGAKFAYEDGSGLPVNLKGANLRSAKNLTREQIDAATTDKNTILPDYLVQPSAPGDAAVRSENSPATQHASSDPITREDSEASDTATQEADTREDGTSIGRCGDKLSRG